MESLSHREIRLEIVRLQKKLEKRQRRSRRRESRREKIEESNRGLMDEVRTGEKGEGEDEKADNPGGTKGVVSFGKEAEVHFPSTPSRTSKDPVEKENLDTSFIQSSQSPVFYSAARLKRKGKTRTRDKDPLSGLRVLDVDKLQALRDPEEILSKDSSYRFSMPNPNLGRLLRRSEFSLPREFTSMKLELKRTRDVLDSSIRDDDRDEESSCGEASAMTVKLEEEEEEEEEGSRVVETSRESPSLGVEEENQDDDDDIMLGVENWSQFDTEDFVGTVDRDDGSPEELEFDGFKVVIREGCDVVMRGEDRTVVLIKEKFRIQDIKGLLLSPSRLVICYWIPQLCITRVQLLESTQGSSFHETRAKICHRHSRRLAEKVESLTKAKEPAEFCARSEKFAYLWERKEVSNLRWRISLELFDAFSERTKLDTSI